MSISPVSPSYGTYQTGGAQNSIRQIRQDFQNLAGALQSGDLSAARTAFSTLQQLMQGFQPGNLGQPQGGNKLKDQFGTDLAAIAKALQSGDLGSAQDALKKLLEEMQAASAGRHHRAQGAQAAGNAPGAAAGAGGTPDGGLGAARIDTTA